MTTDVLEVVDLSSFLQDKKSGEALSSCTKLADILKRTSCLIVRDPRVKEQDNGKRLNDSVIYPCVLSHNKGDNRI